MVTNVLENQRVEAEGCRFKASQLIGEPLEGVSNGKGKILCWKAQETRHQWAQTIERLKTRNSSKHWTPSSSFPFFFFSVQSACPLVGFTRIQGKSFTLSSWPICQSFTDTPRMYYQLGHSYWSHIEFSQLRISLLEVRNIRDSWKCHFLAFMYYKP